MSTAIPQPDSFDDDDDDGQLRGGEEEGAVERPRLKELRRRLREEDDGEGSLSLAGDGGKGDSARPTSAMSQPLSAQTPQSAEEDFRAILEQARAETTRAPSPQQMLTDSYSRHHTYLRISLAERCNLRCQYCMPPEGVPLQDDGALLNAEEIATFAGMFAEGGVNKVRLTGGEPLLRPDLPDIVSSIRSIPGIESVGITTNGLTLSRRLPSLIDAGLTHVNISLDTLREDRFEHITRRKGLRKVLRAIDDAAEAFRSVYADEEERIGRVKINNVVMKGFNDDELRDFASLTLDRDVDVRFIEWMPFLDNGWNRDRFLGYADMMARITGRQEGIGNGDGDVDRVETMTDEECNASLNMVGPLTLRRLQDGPNDTTKWWSVDASPEKRECDGEDEKDSPTFVERGRGRLGFITSMSSHFCGTCNRLRLTADGKLKTCLFGSREVSLRDALRAGATEEELRMVISAAVGRKTFALGGHGSAEGIAKAGDNRPMTLIGG